MYAIVKLYLANDLESKMHIKQIKNINDTAPTYMLGCVREFLHANTCLWFIDDTNLMHTGQFIKKEIL